MWAAYRCWDQNSANWGHLPPTFSWFCWALGATSHRLSHFRPAPRPFNHQPSCSFSPDPTALVLLCGSPMKSSSHGHKWQSLNLLPLPQLLSSLPREPVLSWISPCPGLGLICWLTLLLPTPKWWSAHCLHHYSGTGAWDNRWDYGVLRTVLHFCLFQEFLTFFCHSFIWHLVKPIGLSKTMFLNA